MLQFSVVIPIYNEEGSIAPLCSSLKTVMDSLGQHYEIIFVNDDSNDKSLDALNNIRSEISNLLIVNLDKHYGQSIAIQAGLDIAQGELIIVMDGDLQYDPEDIPKLLDKVKNGYDAVCAWKNHRKDPFHKILSSIIARYVRKIVTREKMHDVGHGFMVLKKSALEKIHLSKGMHRFIALILQKLGHKVTEIKIDRHHRKFGKSKYNIHNRIFEGIVDMARISTMDIHSLMKYESEYKIKEIIKK